MDAGLAAVLGGAVGALATIGAAFVTGRATARSQVDQWRRQHRRDAYARYLGALHDRDIAMDAILDAIAHHEPTEERVTRFVELAREVHRAAEVVLLEGPAAVTKPLHDVGRASEAVAVAMRRLVAGQHAEPPVDELYQAVKRFRAAASDALG
ncbi:MAG TPA: hypothetical protein VHF06_33920 [Pseudonocardiaceae bacterium]|jgi:hypothetical protein|nr:hypothetical protein [Pseudonocardiaceae bacterium]